MLWLDHGRDASAWDAFSDVRRMVDDLDRRLRNPMRAGAEGEGYPPANVWIGDDAVAVTLLMPGVDRERIDLAIENGVLMVRAAHEAPVPEGAKILRRERRTAGYVKRIDLPYRVDADRAEARYRNGVLCIALPRDEADRPRRIQVGS